MTTERILSKNKRQRWDVCEEFSVRHFVKKSTGLKPVKPRMPSHFSESRDPNYRPCVQNVPGKNFSGYSLHPRESGPKFVQRPGSVTISPTLLGPVLVWSQQNYLILLLIVRYRVLLGRIVARKSQGSLTLKFIKTFTDL